jgi:hypothetical protein
VIEFTASLVIIFADSQRDMWLLRIQTFRFVERKRSSKMRTMVAPEDMKARRNWI